MQVTRPPLLRQLGKERSWPPGFSLGAWVIPKPGWGIPTLSSPSVGYANCCLKELDVWSDHAVHCISRGDMATVSRHNSVRNGLDAVLPSAR
jgi:hypothetical protein